MREFPTISRLAPLVAVVFILSSVILFGPLVGLQSPDPPSERAGLANGSANVTILKQPPSSLELERGRYSSGQYVLRVPSAVVSVDSVSGQPLLTYKVQLTELGYAQSTIAELSPETDGRITLSPKPISIDAERVENDTYIAELSIILRASGKQILYRNNVTVHVAQ